MLYKTCFSFFPPCLGDCRLSSLFLVFWKHTVKSLDVSLFIPFLGHSDDSSFESGNSCTLFCQCSWIILLIISSPLFYLFFLSRILITWLLDLLDCFSQFLIIFQFLSLCLFHLFSRRLSQLYLPIFLLIFLNSIFNFPELFSEYLVL